MIGKSKYKINDVVGFWLKTSKESDKKFYIGKIGIIDAYGTFEQNEEPSYDILVDNYNDTGETWLIKHIRESDCVDIVNYEVVAKCGNYKPYAAGYTNGRNALYNDIRKSIFD